ncbi:hypothetical protein, partial [Sphingomonas sp. KC8]|uniref:beta strand repeat-containing protein n=3 Tax=Sphingomonas sp. KC8 TaxID=1030157 RepID=UPI00024889EA
MSGIGIAPQESPRRSRRPLLSSCALAAAMVALGQSPAFQSPASAQSYLGTVLPGSTGATVNNSVPGLTTVTVTAPTAIINWQPNDTSAGTTPIQFQAPGRTTNFESTGSDYTVLNRILPTGAATGRSVLLNGTTNSYIGSSISGGVRGGAVWFYSPDGLILGSSASLNVGSLLLTTRAISDSDFLTGNGVYNFGSADNSRSAITIAGATIDAQYDSSLGISSYIAMVAPRVTQSGSVRVDGSAAYVAAEQARITINNGLFGIEVQSGSAVDGSIPGDDVTLNHTGTTGGPASASASDPQAIYMVAIPKNLAVTMLVNGNVGYDASSAGVENGVVVLSAGSNIDSAGVITNGPASGVGANATLVGGTFSSSTTIHARTDAQVRGNLTLVGDLTVNAGRNAVVDLQAGRSIIVTGMLGVRTLNTDDFGNFARGTAAIDLATNASLSVSGSTSVDASTLQPDAPQGGIARITAGSGASFTTASLAVRADASSFAGNALGGNASVSLVGASLSAGVVTVSAEGNGGADMIGASGTGGTASITVGSSTLNITDGIFVRANGTGGGGFDGGTGGIGTGGNASFTTTGATTNVSTQGPISITAEGYGGGNGTDGIGIGINAGAGRGGTASYSQSGGTVSAGNVLVSATGIGSDGLGSFTLALPGGNGGDGVGGTATFANSGTLDVNSVDVVAHGRGGNGGDGFEFGYGTGTSPDGGNGGNAIGGTASFTLTGSTFASSMSLGADARAGSTGNSQFGALGNGGNATGGNANLHLNGGALDIGSPLTISADGNGGFGVTGGFGRGGSVDMLVTSGGTFTNADNFFALSAAGAGGGTPRTAPGEVGG